MAERSTLRGTRLGAVSYEDDRGVRLAERLNVDYDCPTCGTFTMVFSVEADIPAIWECGECGAKALRANAEPPEEKTEKPARTHWDMLLERRSVDELQDLLDERLEMLRAGDLGVTAEVRVSPTAKTHRGRLSA
jgi:ribosomal protein L37AE/L43A